MSTATWLKVVSSVGAVAVLIVWSIYLAWGTYPAVDASFWEALATVAPTLAIAYAVAISDALRTYQTLMDEVRVAHATREIRDDKQDEKQDEDLVLWPFDLEIPLSEVNSAEAVRAVRLTMAFIAGVIGAFFGLLLAVATCIALLSILDDATSHEALTIGVSHGSPDRQIWALVIAMVFVPLVPFLAHGWYPLTARAFVVAWLALRSLFRQWPFAK